MNEITNIDNKATALFEKVSELIEQARKHVATTVNTAEVYTKYHIGQYIVEKEQEGKERAKYGQQLLKKLSALLTERYGAGWSYPNLKKIRQFYIVYSKRIISDYPIQKEKDNQCLPNLGNSNKIVNTGYDFSVPKFMLSWTHYLILLTVDNPDARSFYEIECAQQQWSKRQLSRQGATSSSTVSASA